MPLVYKNLVTPGGVPYLRADASGLVTLEEAKEFEAQLDRPEFNCGKILSPVKKETEYTHDARKHFPTINHKHSGLAIVIHSLILRASVNLMLRFKRSKGGPVRMFGDESEAIEWLDELHRAQNK